MARQGRPRSTGRRRRLPAFVRIVATLRALAPARLRSRFHPNILLIDNRRKRAPTSPGERKDNDMASDKPIRVAIIGLGFGAEFIPIYQNYPGAEMYAVCRRSKKDLDEA